MHPQRPTNSKDEWITPPELIEALGPFDLDPCSPIVRPWPTAAQHFTINDDGLLLPWPEDARIWMNPPYTNITPWLHKLQAHGNGIALTFARTDRNDIHDYVFARAESIFFFRQRIRFYHNTGIQEPSGIAPSCLIAYGEQNSQAIDQAGFNGSHIPLNRATIILIGMDRSWRMVIKTVFIRLNRPASLEELYRQIELLAPEKVQRNTHYKEKIRQIVQKHFKRTGKAVYSNYDQKNRSA